MPLVVIVLSRYFVGLYFSECADFACRDAIRLVAFDLVLGILCGCVVSVSLVVEIGDMYRDFSAAYHTGFGVPAHPVSCFEFRRHLVVVFLGKSCRSDSFFMACCSLS